MTQATILSGPERRRRWSRAEKVRIVEESLVAGSRVTEVARRHDLHPNLLHWWRRQAREGSLVAGDERPRFVPVAVAAAPASARAAGVRVQGTGVGPLIEVVLRNARLLRIPEDIAPARAVALADALEGR